MSAQQPHILEDKRALEQHKWVFGFAWLPVEKFPSKSLSARSADDHVCAEDFAVRECDRVPSFADGNYLRAQPHGHTQVLRGLVEIFSKIMVLVQVLGRGMTDARGETHACVSELTARCFE